MCKNRICSHFFAAWVATQFLGIINCSAQETEAYSSLEVRMHTRTLNYPGVVAELGLSDEQRSRLAEFAKEVYGSRNPESPDLVALSAFEPRDKVEARGKMLALLNAKQVIRLKQLTNQWLSFASRDRQDMITGGSYQFENIDGTSLRADQKKQIDAIASRKLKEYERQNLQNEAELFQLREKLLAKYLEVLTPEQRKQYLAIVGKAFPFPADSPPRIGSLSPF